MTEWLEARKRLEAHLQPKPKPTIAELEEILASENNEPILTEPDGSLSVGHTHAGDVRAALDEIDRLTNSEFVYEHECESCGLGETVVVDRTDVTERTPPAVEDLELEYMKQANSAGVAVIAAERRRQVEGENWDASHDDEHTGGELALAAACYAASSAGEEILVHGERLVQANSSRGIDENSYSYPQVAQKGYWDPWPWPDDDKRAKHGKLRKLEIAGALIAAEIDRLHRAMLCWKCDETISGVWHDGEELTCDNCDAEGVATFFKDGSWLFVKPDGQGADDV